MKGQGGGNNRLTPDEISLTRSLAVFFLSQQSQHKWHGQHPHMTIFDHVPIVMKLIGLALPRERFELRPLKLQQGAWFRLLSPSPVEQTLNCSLSVDSSWEKKLGLLLYFLLLPCVNYPKLLNPSTINQDKSNTFVSRGFKHLTILSEISSWVFISSH